VLRADDAEEVASSFAAGHDWDLMTRDLADPERGVEYEVIWATEGPVTFHYQEDHVLHEGYVYLAGRDLALVARHEEDLAKTLDSWTQQELLDEAERQPPGPDRGRAILRAGLGAPMKFDRRFFELITEAMRSPEAPVRAIGIRACSYSPVAEYRPELERIAQGDTEQEVRDLAQATLRAFDEFEIGRP